jgi:hypothetical protein
MRDEECGRPKVNVDLWHLEVNGLVQNRYVAFQDLTGFEATEQKRRSCVLATVWTRA